MKKQKILCAHLLNNYTGSPKVLMQVITGLTKRGYEIDLITSKTEGFLSNIDGINYRYINYKWTGNRLVTLFNFILAQLQLFYIMLSHYRNKEIILYTNTLLPFGAVIAGKLTKKKIIYHIHEFYVTNGLLPLIYLSVFNKFADKAIFVSRYLKTTYQTNKVYKIIYNSLDSEYIKQADQYLANMKQKRETILLVSSMKFYKGIYQFIKLSELMPKNIFELILSSSQKEVELFCSKNEIPNNLKVYSLQTNLHPFYQRAKIVVNLSLPDSWIETFGFTILEAMAYGIPTIVPPVGGPKELVEDGFNGFLVDARNIDDLQSKIEILIKDENLYQRFSENAILKSKQFDCNKMIKQIDVFINS